MIVIDVRQSTNVLNCAEPQSLLTMWTNRISAIHRDRCREFSGRLEAGPGNKVELYQHMKEESSSASASVLSDTDYIFYIANFAKLL